MTKKLFALFTILTLFVSCVKNQTDLEHEQSVLYEIFPVLIDSLDFDYIIPPPPPPRPIFDKKGKLIGVDTTGSGKEMADYENRKAELKASSTKLVIAIPDSTYELELTDRTHLIRHFSDYNLDVDSTKLSKVYEIDLNKLIAEEKLEFKYLSTFPKKSEIWKKNYPFHFGGVAYISRILFDNTKSFGVLESGMSNCGLCGGGIRVYIRKENGKWVIDRIVETWIS